MSPSCHSASYGATAARTASSAGRLPWISDRTATRIRVRLAAGSRLPSPVRRWQPTGRERRDSTDPEPCPGSLRNPEPRRSRRLQDRAPALSVFRDPFGFPSRFPGSPTGPVTLLVTPRPSIRRVVRAESRGGSATGQSGYPPAVVAAPKLWTAPRRHAAVVETPTRGTPTRVPRACRSPREGAACAVRRASAPQE
jgi:hypothetical protein